MGHRIAGQAQFKTARLVLRPLRASDEAAAYAALTLPQVAQWLGSLPTPYTPQSFRDYLSRARVGRVWAIAQNATPDMLIGMITLDPDLGYWLAPGAQHQGFAEEAARIILIAHFANPDAPPIESGYFLGNLPSARTQSALGFQTLRLRDVFCRPRAQILVHVDTILTRPSFT